MDMKLEVAMVPVTDVDRAVAFYKSMGWRLDAAFAGENDFRVVQLTPPGSTCSVIFGSGLTDAPPGSADHLLAVSDVEAARAELVDFGVDVSEGCTPARAAAPAQRRRSSSSFPSSQAPDENSGPVQELTTRLSGR